MKEKPFPTIPWSKQDMLRIAKIFAEKAADEFDEEGGHPTMCFVFPPDRDPTLVELGFPGERKDKISYYQKLGQEMREFLGCKPAGMVTVVEIGFEDHPEGEEYNDTLDILVEHEGRQPIMVTYPIQAFLTQKGDLKYRVNRSRVLIGHGRRDHRSMLGHFLLGPGKVVHNHGPKLMPTHDFTLGPFWKWLSDPMKKIGGPVKVNNSGTPTLSESNTTKS